MNDKVPRDDAVAVSCERKDRGEDRKESRMIKLIYMANVGEANKRRLLRAIYSRVMKTFASYRALTLLSVSPIRKSLKIIVTVYVCVKIMA